MSDDSSSTHLKIEASGGFAGASSTSHFHTRGDVDLKELPPDERSAVEHLLKHGPGRELPPGPRYSLSWKQGGRVHQVEIGESELTPTLRASLKTELD